MNEISQKHKKTRDGEGERESVSEREGDRLKMDIIESGKRGETDSETESRGMQPQYQTRPSQI